MRNMIRLNTAIIFFSVSTVLFAENLGAEDIKIAHEQVQQSFNEQCMKNLQGATVELCSCLSEQAEGNLDDDALANCTKDESGINCVSTVVSDASKKTLTQENINACNSKSTSIAPGSVE